MCFVVCFVVSHFSKVYVPLPSQTLAVEYEEAQVEMLHLRRMLQKHDATLQSEAQQLTEVHPPPPRCTLTTALHNETFLQCRTKVLV